MATRTHSSADTAAAREFAIEAARLLSDRHCEDVCVLDVRGLSQVCDFLVLGTGTSDRQMKALADELGALGKANGHPAFRNSADPTATWIVVDFVTVVAHLFEPAQRAYYDLESLWSDAPQIVWARTDAAGSSPAG